LFHNSPITDPTNIFDTFKDRMSDDIRYVRRQQQRNQTLPFIQQDYDECLWRINDIIMNLSGGTKQLPDFNIQLPQTSRQTENVIINH